MSVPDSSAPARASGRWASTFDVLFLAVVVRVALAAYVPTEPIWDGHYYHAGALRMAQGFGYSEDLYLAAADGGEHILRHAWAHYPVGYSAVLSLLYRLFGGELLVGPMLNALTGGLLAALVHRLALAMFAEGDAGGRGGARSLLAALLVALHPGLVLYSGALMTEPLAALAMLLAVWWLVVDRNTLRAHAGAGVALGLATLVRPNALLLLPFLLLAGLLAKPPLRAVGPWLTAVLARGAVLAFCTFAPIAPWTYRNCRTMDACALVSTNAGWNLVIGSAPGATGKFEFLVGNTPKGGPTCAEGGQAAQDRCWFRYGFGLIAQEPLRWLRLWPRKLHYTFDNEWFPISYLREARGDRVSASMHLAVGKLLTAMQHVLLLTAALGSVRYLAPWCRRPMAVRGSSAPGSSGHGSSGMNRWLPTLFHAALAALVLLLALRGYRQATPQLWPLAVLASIVPMLPLPGVRRPDAATVGVAAVALCTVLTHGIFFGEDRYHLVATPALVLLAAGLGRSAERRPAC